MQTDGLGPFFRLEVTANRISDPRVLFRERISLRRGSATAVRGVPARNGAAGVRAGLALANDFCKPAQAHRRSHPA